MKSIEQVKEEYKQCPNSHEREYLTFGAESVYCKECDKHFDLGMKKYGFAH